LRKSGVRQLEEDWARNVRYVDSSKIATHSAFPCAHSACGSCWDQWLAESSKCMVCGVDVVEVKRAHLDLVSMTRHERASSGGLDEGWAQAYLQAEKLGTALDKVLKCLVTTKQKLSDAYAAIQNSHAHIVAADGDSRGPVLMVEGSNIAEQMKGLHELVKVGSWACTSKALEDAQSILEEVAKVLSDPELLEHQTATRIGEAMGNVDQIGVQWFAVQGLRRQVFSEILPETVYAMGQSLAEDGAMLALTAMSALEADALDLANRIDVGLAALQESRKSTMVLLTAPL